MEESRHSRDRVSIHSCKTLKVPVEHSKLLALDLHDDGCPSYCDQNPKGSNKRCEVPVKVTTSIKNKQSWPVVTVELCSDQQTLDDQTDVHFHQDAEFLQNIYIEGSHGSRFPLDICSNINTPTDFLCEFYEPHFLYDTGISICWPQQRLD